MKVGLQIQSFTWPGGAPKIGDTLARIAQTADAAGFYSIWVMDHFFQIVGAGPYTDDMLEGYSTLTYLAANTKKAKLGTLATGVIYRAPGLAVKTATTLDVLSGGRSYFCIGAAWFEQEAKALGFPFPPIATRFEMLEEALQIAKQMWSSNNGPYNGKHYQLAETLCVPQPVSRPHPPIMVAGGGEKKTLRLVAQYADACNIYGDVKGKLDVLRRHCDTVKRDYNAIEKTAIGSANFASGKDTAKSIIDQCKSLAALGVNHAIFNMPNTHELKPLEIFGKEIIPAVAGF
jgi:F420-dependent oxidoreductase-like protein